MRVLFVAVSERLFSERWTCPAASSETRRASLVSDAAGYVHVAA
jgi:hypothetical protein